MEKVCFECRTKVENAIADRHSSTRRPAVGTEYAEWKVLDGERRMTISECDPTASPGGERVFDHWRTPLDYPMDGACRCRGKTGTAALRPPRGRANVRRNSVSTRKSSGNQVK
jgi:hypothetical protein